MDLQHTFSPLALSPSTAISASFCCPLPSRSLFPAFMPCTEFTRSTYNGAKPGPTVGIKVEVAPGGAQAV